MAGSQSYFSVSLLGTSTIGWCVDHGAAEPLSGWYSFTASSSTVGTGGSTDTWLEGSLDPVLYDTASNTSRTQSVTFKAGTSNASWDVAPPAGCTLYVDGIPCSDGAVVSVKPGQTVALAIPDPSAHDSVTLSGTARADASTTTVYRDILITPPGAWDGVSYANGLPAGYQRIATSAVTVTIPRIEQRTLSSSARTGATVRYYVDAEQQPCFTERVPIGSEFAPAAEADAAGAKPDCTPGLDAWYRDRLYSERAAAFVIGSDLDLFGRNLATVHFEAAPSSALQADTASYAAADSTARACGLSELLPSDFIVAWGTVAPLEQATTVVLYWHDGTRWRTLRRPDTGWHRASTALDDPVASVLVVRDVFLYDYWTRSTFDGVLDW